MKDRILFIGLGQAGGNLTLELQKKGYKSMYINTSSRDLENIDSQFIYHIPGATGCAKDRKLALEFAKDSYTGIDNYIEERFKSQDYIYLVGSLGGGTGSGLMPVLLNVLSKLHPNKNYGAVAIFPEMDEDYKTHINAMESYKQLVNTPGIKNLFALDNNNMNRYLLNEVFADKFDLFIKTAKHHPQGNIDDKELSQMLGLKGSAMILDYDFYDDMQELLNYNIYTKQKGRAKVYAFNCKEGEEIKRDDFFNHLGKANTFFRGYNDSTNVVGVFGMSWPTMRMEKLKETTEKDQEEVNADTDFNFNFELPGVKKTESKKAEKPTIDFDSLFGEYEV